ncbi:sensor histidine kinase [Allosphingosinicella indica]|uniref:Histidine kinase-, DNA gyrase B-, and HSP90-like ATPase n=1 Tax=Allosphingosinicella indica TaxID=941907 RepID=A0A1X7GHA7_9SPHN|nr:sensor histidine kinase [Allosphingosinicella indica]SMF69362.1 Histidine kinase-, DNA gyrase B-, and HSP90-like ATPase [Allosphingosinicella indica]
MLTAAPSPPLLDGTVQRKAEFAAAVRLALLFYSCTLAIFTVSGVLRGQTSLIETFGIGVPMMIVDGAMGFSLFFLLRWASRYRAEKRWTLVAIGVFAVAILQSLWDTQLRTWAGIVMTEFGTAYFAFIRSATLNTYNTGMFVALLAFQSSNLKLREHRRLLVASRASERDAHMLALRFQLNPHFLFNTLNAISSLVIVGRADEAESMIDRLSSFLRASLTADPHSLSRVDEEFDMLDSYLEIESVRFGDRLAVDMDLPPDLADALMPPFLLQPLVENAIKYAVAPSTRTTHVAIAAAREGDMLVLTVSDDGDGCGDVAPGTGVGLSNVRERLLLNYGPEANLEKSGGDAGCRVRIQLPLQMSETAAEIPERSELVV